MARTRSWLRIVLVVCVGLFVVALVSTPLLVDEDEILPPEAPHWPPEGPPEGWEDNPYEDYEGKESEEGYEVETPNIGGITSILIDRVLDCVSGEVIPYEQLSLRVVYRDDAVRPFDISDIVGIVVSAPGYLSHAIVHFEPIEFGFLFVTFTVLVPLEAPICLEPITERTLTPTHPTGACVGDAPVSVTSPVVPFAWDSTGSFDAFTVFIYENPCGMYPPGPTPTPTPVPPDTPTTPTPTGPGTTSPPTPTTPTALPQTTTAGVWEPLWDKLCPEQREEMNRRHLEEGLSGWAWVKAAREMLASKGETVPAAATLVEQEDVLLPNTPLVTEIGPIEPDAESVEVVLSEGIEPGEAFIWQVMGVYADEAGETAAMLSEPQCIRYEPVVDLTGDLTPVVACPECVPDEEQWECETPIEVDHPLDYYPKKAFMSPDERIAISVHAKDDDLLFWKCFCFEETLRKIGSYADRVTYEWKLEGRGDLVDPFENSVMYQFPLDVAPGTTEMATIRCKIRAPRGGDKMIEGKVEIRMTGGAEACDDYTVHVTVTPVKEEPCPDPPQEKGRDCLAVLKYGKADGPITGSIRVYNMAYRNEPIILKATHVDTDELTIQCTRTVCLMRPEFDYSLPDPLVFTWSDQGAGGTFPLGNVGRSVVYIPPAKEEVTIQCEVKDLVIRDRDVKEQEQQPIARVVIDLTKCDRNWLPSDDGLTGFTAKIYALHKGQCAWPGPSRRITFWLDAVSHERGVCLNKGTSLNPDLWFSTSGNSRSFHLCDDQTIDNLCGALLTERANHKHWQKATTKQRVAEATVLVQSEDYGAFGWIESLAFNAAPILPRDPGAAVNCTLGKNTVEIPRDDDNNQIADAAPQNDRGRAANRDADNIPVGDPNHPGDGLSNYEEYRGLMIKGRHTRTSITHKDLFIYDQNNLTLGIFPAASGIRCHLIDAAEFNGTASRVINVNRGHATVCEQHGLWLRNRVIRQEWGGVTWCVQPCTPGLVDHVNVDRAKYAGLPAARIRETIAHELGHAVSMDHHGETNTTWDYNPPGPAQTITYTIASPGGQNSGNDQCIMRYTSAHYYRHQTAGAAWVYYGYGGAEAVNTPVLVSDGARVLFCDAAAGTGVNAAGRAPRPKCGNANVGNCLGQIRISDR